MYVEGRISKPCSSGVVLHVQQLQPSHLGFPQVGHVSDGHRLAWRAREQPPGLRSCAVGRLPKTAPLADLGEKWWERGNGPPEGCLHEPKKT